MFTSLDNKNPLHTFLKKNKIVHQFLNSHLLGILIIYITNKIIHPLNQQHLINLSGMDA